ncbi:thiamine biosynthesis protein ApbE [Gilliamella sp. Fer1-1]|jgi:thiamine biosynthesis lipoprotein ApbE|nr:thiamine biosynthesis protein ApbE [Gilliamella apicola]OCG27922.1 thiamine biosynthesis protein ApbE [Gilliamella apicola]OCG31788.1 thiamine biosynthesis protein ApbE [Gilliamella apicola]OCG35960.1 thiamine biosynthesis protein ApbE [Gilliamella apicola]OCG46274.1 thiamine biosynthesis protein ApbE [Gilliamella apicola]
MLRSSYKYTQTLMGTTVSLTLIEPNDTVAQAVFDSIKLLEDKLTVNRLISEVMSINLAAGSHPVTVSSSVFSLIEQAQKVSLHFNSCFNFAIGPLVKLWKIGFNGQQVPPAKLIKQRLLLTDPNNIELDTNNRSVFLKKFGMEIDLGAIAKGYIADVAKLILHKYQVYQGIINLGGNVLTLGSPLTNENSYWHVGLKKPFATDDKLSGVIKVKNKSVVTSGIYERFFIQNNHLYHHILDPKTGYPLDNELDSVTVISNSSLEGDIYSTVFYGWGLDNSRKYLQKHQNLSAIFLLKNKTIALINPDNFVFQLIDTQYKIITD